MKRSSLIIGVIAFILALGISLLSPFCVACLALLLGLGAGYLTGVFDKPGEQRTATKSGAIAGASSGVGLLLGQMIGVVINGYTVGPEGVAQLMRTMGIDLGQAMTPGY